jgi:hypothetical protein
LGGSGFVGVGKVVETVQAVNDFKVQTLPGEIPIQGMLIAKITVLVTDAPTKHRRVVEATLREIAVSRSMGDLKKKLLAI